MAHARALAADPRFRPHFHQLCDFVDVTDVQVKVFRDIDPALEWLAVADAKAELLRALSAAPSLDDARRE
ncbi:MAG TPA: hypothetical protein VGV60_13065 [Candidatus Polarisedimenticolia bacterium]|nr:hypothetical protein [Candidatus Polarisedimenticolia bacterium]